MIILDTNVLSELIRREPNPIVGERLSHLSRARTFTTVICLAEVLVGLSILPAGKKKAMLHTMITALLRHEFAGRILPYEADAAAQYAEILAQRRRIGRPISMTDAQIAAIARHHGAILCTRNGKDFEGCGIRIWDPWTEELELRS